MFEIPPDFYSPSDFITNTRQNDNVKSLRIAETLRTAAEIIPFLQKRYPELRVEVELRIADTDQLIAEGSPYSIYISRGIIQHCIGAPCIEVDEISPVMSAFEFDYNSLSENALSWIIAHEYFHISRKHNEVAAAALEKLGLGSEALIASALEHDADLMAVAAMYRFLQFKLHNNIHDLDIRRLTAYSIFFSLRTFSQISDDDIHSPMPERLFHMLQKLIQVVKNPNETVSVSGPTEFSRERVEPVTSAFVSCENHFRLTNEKSSDFFKIFQTISQDADIFKISHAWAKISPYVERVTGTRSNNNIVNAPLKPIMCVFCNSKNVSATAVIPSWIAEMLDNTVGYQTLSEVSIGLRLDDASIITAPMAPYIRPTTLGSENIYRVCRACLDTWLLPLETNNKTLIEDMIKGTSGDLSKKGLRNICLYMSALCILHEYTDPNPDNWIIPDAEKKKIRQGKIPNHWILALRPLEDNKKLHVRSHHCGNKRQPLYRIFNLQAGKVLFQLVSLFNVSYPLYFPRATSLQAYPFRDQLLLSEIAVTPLDELPDAFDELHAIMHRWILTQTYEYLTT
ncbi:hypothetical protein [Pseudomonas syringae]